MKRRHLLVVGGRDHTLDKIDALGVRYSMMQVPELANQRQSENAVGYAAMDYRDLDAVLSVAGEWHRADPFDAAVSFTEYGLEAASRCAVEFGIPGDNLEAVLLTRNKADMRDLLQRNGLSPVRHRVCASVDDARGFIRDLGGGPVVLKPPAGGLSDGVCVVETEAQLEERWVWTRSATLGPLLAEEFLSGPEFSVESISLNGEHDVVMITEKLTTPLPRFIELGHQVPARLDRDTRARITELVGSFLTLVRQNTAPAHTELRLTRSGPRLIESQTRMGGDQIWEMCQLVSGADVISATIAGLLDLPQPPRKSVAAAAAIRFFGYENLRILGVQDVAAARNARGVIRISCSLEPGQELGPLTSSDSRQGYVLCEGTSVEDAVTNAEAARDLVRVKSEPLAGVPDARIQRIGCPVRSPCD